MQSESLPRSLLPLTGSFMNNSVLWMCTVCRMLKVVVPAASSEAAEPLPATFDLIVCLNVLDRCSEPFTLLRSIRDKLEPETGRCILAVPLPLSPSVEIVSSPRDHCLGFSPKASLSSTHAAHILHSRSRPRNGPDRRKTFVRKAPATDVKCESLFFFYV